MLRLTSMRAQILPLSVAAAWLGACSGPPQPPANPTIAVVTSRPASSPEQTSAPAASSAPSFETCPKSNTTTVEVGEADVFWWCQNGVIGHRALAAGVQETVTQLAGGGWLALDGDQLYVSQAAGAKATLFRMPRTGGTIVKIGQVPPGPIVPRGSYVWIGTLTDGIQSFTGGLYRIATAGGAVQLVGAPGDVVAVAKSNSTILFLQLDPADEERSHLWSVDPDSLATKHVARVGRGQSLHAGGGYAYVDGFRIDLAGGKLVPGLGCGEVLAATPTRVVARCMDKTVRIGTHAAGTLTPVPGAPAVSQPIFGGPQHVCWVSGKLGDRVQCVAY